MSEFTHFKDREDAGRQLARRLQHYADNPNVLVLGLPRGGVPVAYQVAHALRAPLDILLVRKLGLPGHEEYAMGAIAGGGIRVLQKNVLNQLHVSPAAVQEVIDRETQVIAQREHLYRDGTPALPLEGRIVIVVDDGLATGSTMRVAVEAVRRHQPARLVVAVPVGAPDACASIGAEVDEMVCLSAPMLFQAVSQWYADFGQTSDADVQDLLAKARQPDRAQEARAAGLATQFTR